MTPTPPPADHPLPVLIRTRLEQALGTAQVSVRDDSHLHVGHAGAASGGGHYHVAIVSPAFAGRSRVARHRLVYDCLADLMRREIHALSLTTLTPEEFSSSPAA